MGLEWNKNQLIAAFHLSKGKDIYKVMEETGLKYNFVYKVQHAMKTGDNPPSLEEEYIKNAKPPKMFGKFQKKEPESEALTPAKAGEGGKGDGGKPKAETKALSGKLKFFGTLIECEYTPIMAIARTAAVEEWGWDPNMRFEDFMDTILYHFFKDRGITLQGYIVDAEVEDKVPEGVASK